MNAPYVFTHLCPFHFHHTAQIIHSRDVLFVCDQICYKIVGRRAGDVESLYADAGLAMKELDWKATREQHEMCMYFNVFLIIQYKQTNKQQTNKTEQQTNNKQKMNNKQKTNSFNRHK